MTSILILQNEIKAYRKPVYNGLALYYEVVVLHSGPQSVTGSDRYREVITPKKLFWRFHLQPDSPLFSIIDNFDVVIAMFDLSWPAYLCPLFFRRRAKFILWGHWYSTSRIVNSIRNYLMKKADRLLLYGDEEVTRMIRSGIDRKKIYIAPNTVDISDPKNFSSYSKTSLIFIGRLQGGSRRNSKRADILIESFAALQGSIPDHIVLDIVGSGEELDSLKRLSLQYNIDDKVIFHGHIDDRKRILELFSTSIALVSPGHVGLSVLQSFGHGVPVVTGKAVQYRQETQHLFNLMTGNKVIMGPEYYNLSHGINSLLVESTEHFEAMLEKLCNDPAYAQYLGSNAYNHYVEKRPLSLMLNGFRKVIEE